MRETTVMAGATPRQGATVLGAALVAILFTALLGATWVGFIESDDLEYARSATLWLTDFPHLGQSHWGLRHLIVLPIAASFALFGRGEFALVLPTILYAGGIVAMTGLCVRAVAGPLAGLLASVLVVCLPVLITGASVVYSDIPEAFFVLASLWAYHFAASRRSARLFVLSGILAGCGFITRETTLALLVLYLVLFLMAPRRMMDFVRMGVGCLLVVGLDFAWLWAASGDPLWRMHISQGGVAGDNPSLAKFVVNAGGLDRHGVIVAPRQFQALLAIFANQSMGLLAWAAVPAAIAIARRPSTAGRPAALLFAGLALLWFLVLGYAFLFMWIVPRYQTVTMVALCVPLGIWLSTVRSRLILAGIVVVLAATGIALATVADRELLFGERGLVAFARATTGPIRTDPATLRGADWPLENEGLRARVSAGPCAPGGLCYVNPRPRRPLPADWTGQAIPPGATPILDVPRGSSAMAWLLSRSGLLALAPGAVRAKLDPAPVIARGVRMPG